MANLCISRRFNDPSMLGNAVRVIQGWAGDKEQLIHIFKGRKQGGFIFIISIANL